LDLRWGFETTSVKAYAIQRSQLGFTLIEIVVVLILMAIISAYVIGRSVTTDRVEVTGQTDRIRNQIRFAQSVSMKQSNRICGVKLDSNTNQYWFFSIPFEPELGETVPDMMPVTKIWQKIAEHFPVKTVTSSLLPTLISTMSHRHLQFFSIALEDRTPLISRKMIPAMSRLEMT
jgi:prepilin-type N-terminal cleavage/methylation domain-containing protein